MTDHQRTFPILGRASIVAALLALVCVVTTVALAAPSKEDVERAKARLEAIEHHLADIRDDLAAAQLELNEKADEVEKNQIALEEIQADLLRTRSALERAETRYDRITQRLNERAVEAYIQGPATSIDFVLGAETVAELTDRLAYADALAQADAELAVEVANLRNELTVLQAQLQSDRERQARALAKSKEDEARVLELFDTISALESRHEGLLVDAEKYLRKTKRGYQDWLEDQQSQDAATGGGTWTGGPLPEPYDGVLERCPVDEPRGFGDGFGAPRYAGGYHLHKGVDIVAPYGTEIYAPFDGYSYTSSNSLGGQVVFVVGRYGRAYNAHLQSYSANSNGSVSAGEVIGYVGDTGDSPGSPHDHFEFHPNTIPSPWPDSYYHYSVIEDAINPYPLLVQACG
jgi:murein DD-endopeptidase MepM/ murein hydrolase activator NlpD